MSETIIKKKKKIDYSLLRKLEDEYDEAVEDLENKEEILIKKVHSEYLKADNIIDFFKELQHGRNWYTEKFKDYELLLKRENTSASMVAENQERKVASIISDLDEMEKDIVRKPTVEIDAELLENEDYVDPKEQEKDWIHRTKIELQSTEPKKITTDSNFGKYQETKGMISKIEDLQVSDFKVSEKYKIILINKLDKAISYLNVLRGKLDEKN